MRGGLVTVRSDPGDLDLKLGNPLVEFGQRIGIEAFLRQCGGSVAFGPRQIIVHYGMRIGRGGLAVNRVSS